MKISTVIEIELDGKKREVTQLDITAHAYGVGTGLVEDFVENHSMITPKTKYVVKLAGKSHNLLVSGTISLIQDKNKFRAVLSTGAGWYAGELVGSATTALATAVAVAAGVAGAPIVVAGIAVLGVSSGVVAGWYGSEKTKDLYDAIKEFFGSGSGKTNDAHIKRDQNGTTISTIKTLEQSLAEFQSILDAQEQIVDLHATIPSVSNPDNFAEQLKYDNTNQTATIKTSNKKTLTIVTETLLKTTQAEKLTINGHTAQVVEPTENLQLRNALNAIDDYQFLLSTVWIHPGELLDMGAAGIVKVQKDDTLSELAVKYFGGDAVTATREAVLHNPWLADKGQVSRNQMNNISYRREAA